MLICIVSTFYVVNPLTEIKAVLGPSNHGNLSLGLFAPKPIPRGTRIVSDTALLQLPKGYHTMNMLQAYDALTPNQKILYESLPWFQPSTSLFLGYTPPSLNFASNSFKSWEPSCTTI